MKTGPTKNDNSSDKTDLHKHLESRHWKDDVFNFFDSHIRELQVSSKERDFFYLTTHSTHFIYGYMASDIWLRTIVIVTREKGNPLPPLRLLLSINSKGSLLCTIPHRITHTMAFVTPVVEHWQEREIAQWVHPMKDRSDDPSHHKRTLYL